MSLYKCLRIHSFRHYVIVYVLTHSLLSSLNHYSIVYVLTHSLLSSAVALDPSGSVVLPFERCRTRPFGISRSSLRALSHSTLRDQSFLGSVVLPFKEVAEGRRICFCVRQLLKCRTVACCFLLSRICDKDQIHPLIP